MSWLQWIPVLILSFIIFLVNHLEEKWRNSLKKWESNSQNGCWSLSEIKIGQLKRSQISFIFSFIYILYWSATTLDTLKLVYNIHLLMLWKTWFTSFTVCSSSFMLIRSSITIYILEQYALSYALFADTI